MKYIIKNCPAYRTECKEIFNFLGSEKIFHACLKSAGISCKDITDCVLKRIVDVCKNAQNTRDLAFINIEMNFTGEEIAKLYGKADLANEILKLLEIEEVDEN